MGSQKKKIHSKYREFQHAPFHPHHSCLLPEGYICYSQGTSIDTLSSPNAHSLYLCCTFSGVWQMCPPYSIIHTPFTSLKIPCAPPSLLTPPLSKSLTTTDLFTFSIVFAFSRMSYSWNKIIFSLFRLASFT